MFSISDFEFMANKMKIDVCTVEAKLNEPFLSDFKEIAVEAIGKYIEEIKRFESLNPERDPYSFSDNEAEEFIRSHYCDLSDRIHNEKVLQVFDALRHTFSCYAYNGLHQLYTRQENENWHPKIRLTEVLTPNDIDTLPTMVKIYRGCDAAEYENRLYGQAWTTSLQVAKDFAYKHYENQDWYNYHDRTVLETVYSRDYLLFSHQSVEFEVVVDTRELQNVRKHT